MKINLEEMTGNIKKNVLFGKEGYLFLYSGAHRQFDYLLSIKKPTQDSINCFVNNIRERIIYFKKKNIRYRHIVFPSKPLVKKEYLPKKFQAVKSIYSKYYRNALGNDHKIVLYPLDELVEAEKNISTFSSFDTHNNSYGTLILVNYILRNLNMKHIDNSSYSMAEQEVSGDLSKMLGMDYVSKEPKIFFNIDKNTKIYENFKYIPGYSNHVVITMNTKAINKKRLLIFGDSFFHLLIIRILHLLFSEILYIRSSFIHKDIIDRL